MTNDRNQSLQNLSQFDRGVFSRSTWHKLETTGEMTTADQMINHGLGSGAWPVDVNLEPLFAEVPAGNLETGLEYCEAIPASEKAVVATYQHGSRGSGDKVVQGIAGKRYRPLDPRAWQETVRAAVDAGARPSGAFALNGGRKILATFELPSDNGLGLKSFLNVIDSLDGSCAHMASQSMIRVTCANTLAASVKSDAYAKVRHTSTVDHRASLLRDAVAESLSTGQKIVDLYQRAKDAALTRSEFEELMEQLFPSPSEDDTANTRTRKQRAQLDALRAANLGINNEGQSLATVWNAATYLVDREADGSARAVKGGGSLHSMLYGARAKRVQAVMNLVEVTLANGDVVEMAAPEAVAAGVDESQIGRQILAGDIVLS